MEGLYVLIDDSSNIVALFQNDEETGDVIRRDSDWVAPTLSEIEEWDGFLVVTIEPSFVEIYDNSQASGETLDESAVQEYKTEMSQ
jgi:hypothetical protein